MQVFVIEPAPTKAMWVMLGGTSLVVGVVLGVLLLAALSARNARFEVTAQGLRIRGDVYGRHIPAGELLPETARRVDFAATPGLRPTARRLGTGLPGYSAGWFRLANGEKALVYLTDRTHAVYVGTSAGYSVLLSPADPDGFVAALAGASAR